MGHLLSTVNPEAAADIQPSVSAVAPVIAPYIGQVVQYHARPGEGRSGKMTFPAMVMHYDPHTTNAQLIVFYAADDILERVMIPFQTTETLWPSWSYVPDRRALRLEDGMDHVFGSHAIEETESVMDRLVKLEKQIVEPFGDGARVIINRAERDTAELRAAIGGLSDRLVALGKRLADLEAKRGPGRPPKAPKD